MGSKAISGLLIAVMLVIISVTLSLTFLFFGQSVSEHFQQTTEEGAKREVCNLQSGLAMVNTAEGKITVKNSGKAALDTSKFDIFVAGTRIAYTADKATIAPGETVLLTLTDAFVPGMRNVRVSGECNAVDEGIVPMTLSGTVALWDFEETGGNVAEDALDRNDGALTNGPARASDVPSQYSKFSLDLDGSNDFVSVPDSSQLQISGEISIEAWFKWDGSGTTVQFLTAKGFERYEIHTGGGGGSNGLRFIPRDGFYANTGDNAFAPGTWNHVVATYSGGTAKIYVNGVKKAEVGGGGALVTDTSSFSIGRRGDNSFFFDGKIDYVAVYNRALSAAEISGIYNAGVS